MLIFDTLAFSERLQKANFTPEQARTLTEELKEILDENVATKRDTELIRKEMEEVRADLKRDIKELEAKMETSLKELDNKLETSLKELELRLLVRLGGIMVVGVGIVATLVKIL